MGIVLPLLLVALVVTGALGHSNGSEPPRKLSATQAGLTRDTDISTAAAPSPTPSSDKDSLASTPLPHTTMSTLQTPASSSPTPAAKPPQQSESTKVQAITPQCAALQKTWSQSMTTTIANATWQRVQGLLSMLLSSRQQNAIIDTYNSTVQSGYNSLLDQAKSAQCSLGLSAPAVYPRVN